MSGIVIVVLELPMRKLSCRGLESDWDLRPHSQRRLQPDSWMLALLCELAIAKFSASCVLGCCSEPSVSSSREAFGSGLVVWGHLSF